ncbi:putative cytochrome b5 [Escovopsis weberi]|uniref:Putative cytochrome b5 n=1 Tax=Escovopsis weberi TaxID=150374 RepID=A0A0M8MWV3_ESCWE|nr:putative cytochrome b5 [Escovopsis weberi]
MSDKKFTVNEVAKFKDDENGYYLIIDHNVYDVTKFKDEHPGGEKVLKRFYGKDATKPFNKYHNETIMPKYGEKYKVGVILETAKL